MVCEILLSQRARVIFCNILAINGVYVFRREWFPNYKRGHVNHGCRIVPPKSNLDAPLQNQQVYFFIAKYAIPPKMAKIA